MNIREELNFLADILEQHYGRDGLATQRTEPVVRMESIRQIIRELGSEKWIREGGLHGKAMADFLPLYLKYCTKMPHPGNMNHQVSVPNPLSGIAGLIAGTVSNPMNIYEMGPAAAALEFFLINHFLTKVGWTPQPYPDAPQHIPSGGGLLTHGGTLATLNAIVASRSRALRENRLKNKTPVIVSSDTGHFAVAQAALVMAAENITVVTDENGSMIPAALRQTLQKHRDKGVITVVANSCNTPVGAFDDLHSLVAICREYAVPLHVDAAHGGSLLMSKKLRHRLNGIELADTVVWDAHKLMRTNGICTLLLARDRKDLDLALQRNASYIFHAKEQPGFDFMGRTLECTKTSLAFNLFHSLAYAGEDAIGNYVEQVCELTETASEILRHAGQVCAVPPQCNILCFRPPQLHDDAITPLRDKLRNDHNFFLSSTLFKGKRWLRLVIMSPHTQQQDIEKLASCLRDTYSKSPQRST